MVNRRYASRKDLNQGPIVAALEKAKIAVIDCSDKGAGFPDLIVCRRGVTHLVEIKNPENSYGRRGANRNQKEWAASWPGTVYILRHMDDVEAFVAGRFDQLPVVVKSVGEAVEALMPGITK
jgi:hypothetical protein